MKKNILKTFSCSFLISVFYFFDSTGQTWIYTQDRVNSLGKIVFKKEFCDDHFVLETTEFADGLYFLQCSNENYTLHAKFLVVH
jgi:hypothetical protein